jgi:hypothetical protein
MRLVEKNKMQMYHKGIEPTEAELNRRREASLAASDGSAKWVILFTSIGGVSDEWETADGTLEQATAQATCDRRHLNYGRNGFRIVADISPNEKS